MSITTDGTRRKFSPAVRGLKTGSKNFIGTQETSAFFNLDNLFRLNLVRGQTWWHLYKGVFQDHQSPP